MRRILTGALSLLRYALLGFMLLAFIHHQWQPMFWFLATSWIVFISQIKFSLELKDSDARALLAAAQLSLPPVLLAGYFGSRHNWAPCIYLLSGFVLAAIMSFVMGRLEKRNPRVRWIVAWIWIVAWQGGSAVILAWLAFLR